MNLDKIEKIRKEAYYIIQDKGKDDAYRLATDILWWLSARYGYCIWQTYTRDDVEANIGRKPTDDDMRELEDNLQFFENIRTV
jgi:hypothetical protein